jgi:hypothetical protein
VQQLPHHLQVMWGGAALHAARVGSLRGRKRQPPACKHTHNRRNIAGSHSLELQRQTYSEASSLTGPQRPQQKATARAASLQAGTRTDKLEDQVMWGGAALHAARVGPLRGGRDRCRPASTHRTAKTEQEVTPLSCRCRFTMRQAPSQGHSV